MRSAAQDVLRPDGSVEHRPVWSSVEDLLPMQVETIPTGVEGLRLERIAYSSVAGRKRSLVLLVADRIETLARHVRVSNANPKFRWDARWFPTLGDESSDKP